jgi:hypothetical protein
MAFTTDERKRKTRVLLERVAAERVSEAIGALDAGGLADLDLYLEQGDKLRFRQVAVNAGGVTVNQAADRASLQAQVRALLNISATPITVLGL